MPHGNGTGNAEKPARMPGGEYYRTNELRGKSAADQLLYADCNDYGANGQINMGNCLTVWYNTTTQTTNTSSRHFGKANAVFMDGHADARKPAEFMINRDSKWFVYNRFYYYWSLNPIN